MKKFTQLGNRKVGLPTPQVYTTQQSFSALLPSHISIVSSSELSYKIDRLIIVRPILLRDGVRYWIQTSVFLL